MPAAAMSMSGTSMPRDEGVPEYREMDMRGPPRIVMVAQRLLQVHYGETRRLSVGQPSQCVAARAYPFLGIRARLRLAAGDANVLSRRSAVRVRSDLQLGAG